MVRSTQTNDDESVIDEKYRPVYEYDESGSTSYVTTGEVVDKVPRADQISALKSVEGEGVVEPDGWFQGYNGGSLPVLGGVPITVIGHSTVISTRSEGAERSTEYAVDDALGVVEVHKAFAHPDNTSKIKVSGDGEESQ